MLGDWSWVPMGVAAITLVWTVLWSVFTWWMNSRSEERNRRYVDEIRRDELVERQRDRDILLLTGLTARAVGGKAEDYEGLRHYAAEWLSVPDMEFLFRDVATMTEVRSAEERSRLAMLKDMAVRMRRRFFPDTVLTSDNYTPSEVRDIDMKDRFARQLERVGSLQDLGKSVEEISAELGIDVEHCRNLCRIARR